MCRISAGVNADLPTDLTSLLRPNKDTFAASAARVPALAGDFDSLIRLAHGERWYVAHTKPQREIGAQQQLAAQGVRSFLPLYRKTVRHARKLTTVTAAFFPRYLFVRLDMNRDAWRSVNGTFGVISLVMDETLPRPVPHGVLEALAQAFDENGFVQLGGSLKVGGRVRVLTGPFADLVGELVRLDGARRAQVLLQLLGGVVRASIDRNDLVPARVA